jgi:hypothetical protein
MLPLCGYVGLPDERFAATLSGLFKANCRIPRVAEAAPLGFVNQPLRGSNRCEMTVGSEWRNRLKPQSTQMPI